MKPTFFLRSCAAVLVVCLFSLSGFWQTIDFTIIYNDTTAQYEVYGKSATTMNTVNLRTSQLSVVLPFSAPNVVLNPSPIVWNDVAQDFSPLAQPGNDFHAIFLSTLNLYDFPANTEVLLFSFTLSPCVAGVRLYENGVDATLNGDFNNHITNVTTSADITGTNYNNGGTVCAALGVNLVSFTAEKNNRDVLLSWSATNEDIGKYNILRSFDGKNWTSLSLIAPVNNSNVLTSYSYRDHDVLASSSQIFYRLQIFDVDGKVSYTKVVSVRSAGSEDEIILSPNPVNAGNFFEIKGIDQTQTIMLSVRDVLGELKTEKTFGGNAPIRITTADWRPGIYLLQLQNKNGILFNTMVDVR